MKPTVSDLNKKMRLAHLEYTEAKKTAAWHRAGILAITAVSCLLMFYLKNPYVFIVCMLLCAVEVFIRWAYQQANNCSVSKLRLKYEAAKLEYEQAFEEQGRAEINKLLFGDNN